MGEQDLYLFPDGRYLYYVLSDIPPATIRDKGRWAASDEEVMLTSDTDITWNPGADRRYLLVHRRSHPQEILAVGLDRELRYFEKNSGKDPEFMLLLVSKTRVSGISEKESIELRKKLMREAWNPTFYTAK